MIAILDLSGKRYEVLHEASSQNPEMAHHRYKTFYPDAMRILKKSDKSSLIVREILEAEYEDQEEQVDKIGERDDRPNDG